MVRWAGVEPATKGLKGPCSTTELPAHGFITFGSIAVLSYKINPRIWYHGVICDWNVSINFKMPR